MIGIFALAISVSSTSRPFTTSVEHRERLHRLDRDDVGALRGFVTARRRDELDLDVAAPRLVELHLRQQVVVDRVHVRARRRVGHVVRLDRVGLELGFVRHHRDDRDAVLGDALPGRAAVVGTRPSTPSRTPGRRRPTVVSKRPYGPVLRIVVTALRVVERGLVPMPEAGRRRAGALRPRERCRLAVAVGCRDHERADRGGRARSEHHREARTVARTSDRHDIPPQVHACVTAG